jgi:hypothetical protein
MNQIHAAAEYPCANPNHGMTVMAVANVNANMSVVPQLIEDDSDCVVLMEVTCPSSVQARTLAPGAAALCSIAYRSTAPQWLPHPARTGTQQDPTGAAAYAMIACDVCSQARGVSR